MLVFLILYNQKAISHYGLYCFLCYDISFLVYFYCCDYHKMVVFENKLNSNDTIDYHVI